MRSSGSTRILTYKKFGDVGKPQVDVSKLESSKYAWTVSSLRIDENATPDNTTLDNEVTRNASCACQPPGLEPTRTHGLAEIEERSFHVYFLI